MSPGAASETARARAWRVALAARLAVLALAAAGAAFALWSGGARPVATGARYACPMHADATSDGPAACPICGMALVRDDAPAGGPRTGAPPPTARAARSIVYDEVRAPAWVDPDGDVTAQLYADDLADAEPGLAAQLFIAAGPPRELAVARTADPPAAWDGETVHARFRAVAGEAPRGAHGYLVIAARPRAVLAVPTTAVLDLPGGAAVLVLDPTTRRAARRAVRVGRERRGQIAVLDGLAAGDEVVVVDTFFAATELALHPEAR